MTSAPRFHLQPLLGPRLVDHVDRLVGQEAVGDVAAESSAARLQGRLL